MNEKEYYESDNFKKQSQVRLVKVAQGHSNEIDAATQVCLCN